MDEQGWHSYAIELEERLKVVELDRDQTKAQLNAKIRELEAVLDAVPAIVWVTRDPESKVVTGNRAAHDFLRVPAGKNLSKSASEEEAPRNFRVYRNGQELTPEELPLQLTAATGQPVREFEEEVVFENGERAQLLGNVSALRDEQGGPCGAVAAFIDISQRKQAEQALLESEERGRHRLAQLEAILETLPVGVALTDVAGASVMQNEAFHQIWGGQQTGVRSLEDYSAFKAWWLDSGLPLQPEEWASNQVIQLGKAVTGQLLKIRRFDGRDAYVLNSAAPIRDARGNITGSAVTIQDITDLREAEQKLQEINEQLEQKVFDRTQDLSDALKSLGAVKEELRVQNEKLLSSLANEKAMRERLIQAEKNAAMSRLIASIAHEIQNPLQTIKNSLFLLNMDANPPEYQEALDMAISESKRVGDLVAQLRETYRPTEVKVVEYDLYAVLEKVHRLMEPQFRQNKIEWKLTQRAAQAMITGVPDRLQQVFMNICINAADAMGAAGGQLLVGVDIKGGNVQVTFEDTGPGVPPELCELIFEPFFTTKANGTGLGLAICYEIVKDQGGTITVDSQPGRGACFQVVLPLKR